jgi:hypothetical protein
MLVVFDVFAIVLLGNKWTVNLAVSFVENNQPINAESERFG